MECYKFGNFDTKKFVRGLYQKINKSSQFPKIPWYKCCMILVVTVVVIVDWNTPRGFQRNQVYSLSLNIEQQQMNQDVKSKKRF